MPIIYLSPSTQENNFYVTGTGTEEDWMNRLADAMIPYLNSCGIRYTRNTPDMTAGSSIRQANSGWYDFYLALPLWSPLPLELYSPAKMCCGSANNITAHPFGWADH